MLRTLLFVPALLLLSLLAIAQPSVCFKKAADKRSFIHPREQLDSAMNLSTYKAFFFGEGHVPSLIPLFEAQFILHLNETYGVKDVFLEVGYATAWLYNQYLITGDSATFMPEHSFYPFWKRLYDYNKSLPEGKRLIIHGVDFERRSAFKALLLLRPQHKKAPPELASFFASLNDAASDTTLQIFSKSFASKWRLVKDYFTAHDETLTAYYGQYMETVRPIINNDAVQSPNLVRRNKIMGTNLLRAIGEQKINRFVAVFGGAHTRYEMHSSMPNQVRRQPLFKDRTLCIAALLHNVDSAYNHTAWPYIGIAENEDNPAMFQKFVPTDCRAAIVRSEYTGEKNVRENCDWVWMADEAN